MVQIGRPSIVQRHGQLERFTGSLIVQYVEHWNRESVTLIATSVMKCWETAAARIARHQQQQAVNHHSLFPTLHSRFCSWQRSDPAHCSTAGQVPGHRDTQTQPHLEFCNLHWHPHGAGRGEDTAERRVLHSTFTLTRSSAVSGLPGCSLLPRANWENNHPHFTWDDHKETGTTKSVGSELCFAIYLIF